MTDIHDRLLELEERAYSAAAAADSEGCEAVAREAAELDPDSWIILFSCGCADMRAGRAADAIAQWMAAADRMEDERDIERMSDAVAEVTAECVRSWPYPANVELAGIMALSGGLSDLTGGPDGGFMVKVLKAIGGLAGAADTSAQAELLQAASEVTYTAVMFGTDLRGSAEAARALLGIADTVMASMEARGVPESMGGVPVEGLRGHVGLRMEAYRCLVDEWDAASTRFSPEQIEGIAAYWGGKASRVEAMVLSMMDAGFQYSRTGSDADREAVRRAAKMLVLKWLRIRK